MPCIRLSLRVFKAAILLVWRPATYPAMIVSMMDQIAIAPLIPWVSGLAKIATPSVSKTDQMAAKTETPPQMAFQWQPRFNRVCG